MRKLTLGVFSILTVSLFVLSSSVNVAAATIEKTYFDLESVIDDDGAHAECIQVEPGLNPYLWFTDRYWINLDVDEGDDVKIYCTYDLYDWYEAPPTPPPQPYGRHTFYFSYDYPYGGVDDSKSAQHYSAGGDPPPHHVSETWDLTVQRVSPGRTIYVQYYVETINYVTSQTEVDNVQVDINLV
jgi:hypothetical protein